MRKIGFSLMLVIFLSAIISAFIETDDQDTSVDGMSEARIENVDVQSALETLKINLESANEENVERYLKTIASTGREETENAMNEFFAIHNVTHELLSFEVVDQSQDKIVLETRQESIGSSSSSEEYRDHKSEVLHVFVPEDGDWVISESSVKNIEFIN